MKTAFLLLVALLVGCSDQELIVNRILDREVHQVKAGGEFRFWREVCANSDLVIDVHRSFFDVIKK